MNYFNYEELLLFTGYLLYRGWAADGLSALAPSCSPCVLGRGSVFPCQPCHSQKTSACTSAGCRSYPCCK